MAWVMHSRARRRSSGSELERSNGRAASTWVLLNGIAALIIRALAPVALFSMRCWPDVAAISEAATEGAMVTVAEAWFGWIGSVVPPTTAPRSMAAPNERCRRLGKGGRRAFIAPAP